MSENKFENISEVDLAYKILTEAGKDRPIHYKDLILDILKKKQKEVQNEAAAISEVYTMINMDSRFQHVGEGRWGLVEWNPPELKRGRGSRTKATATAAAEKVEGTV